MIELAKIFIDYQILMIQYDFKSSLDYRLLLIKLVDLNYTR